MRRWRQKPSINLRSLYLKWGILFLGLMLLTQGMAAIVVTVSQLPQLRQELAARLEERAVSIQNLYAEYEVLHDDVLQLLMYTDVEYVRWDESMLASNAEVYQVQETVTSEMKARALQGEIVIGDTHGDMPYCLFKAGDGLIILKPNFSNNMLTIFMGVVREILWINSLLAAFFSVIVVVIIMRPIRKVTRGTQEVAKGNFEVRLKHETRDEIGQLVRNFNRMVSELKNMEYLRKDFVSSVSHEFKTPLTSIEGYVELLRDPNVSAAELEEYTDIIRQETKRLSNLSSNLLALSVLDHQEIITEQETFDVAEQMRHAILLLQKTWEAKHIDWSIELEELVYRGQKELLMQVWLNLFSNAIKFSEPGGEIIVRAQKIEHTIEISVRDYGPGISNEAQLRIFERFYQVDRSRAKEGNGLGLSIVKKIVELEGGKITCYSIPGEGACFKVILPLSQDKSQN